MIVSISILLVLVCSTMGGTPIQQYLQPVAASSIVRQPYPVYYQNIFRQPATQYPVYPSFQQTTFGKQQQGGSYQFLPTFVSKQNLPVLQADTRKIVLQEPRPAQEEQSNPNYSFAYAVDDDKTGDHKSHQESRNGDNVVGKYTVVEPDGTLRIVTYTAGKDGFNAVVERQPPEILQPDTTKSQQQNLVSFPVREIVAAKPSVFLQSNPTFQNFENFPVRKILAQRQPLLYRPIVAQAQSVSVGPSSYNFGNYYHQQRFNK